MKNTIICFGVGVLLFNLVLIAYQVLATTPNPGHNLICNEVTAYNAAASLYAVYCATGYAATGCYTWGTGNARAIGTNGCQGWGPGSIYAKCCVVGI